MLSYKKYVKPDRLRNGKCRSPPCSGRLPANACRLRKTVRLLYSCGTMRQYTAENKVKLQIQEDMKKSVLAIIAGTVGFGLAFAQGPRSQGPQDQDRKLSETERIEKRVSFLKERLSLNDKQAEDLTALFTRQDNEKKEAVEAHRKAMQEMAEKNKTDFEKILTREQLDKLEKMRAERPQPQAGPAGHWRGPQDCPAERHHREFRHRPPHEMPQACDSCRCDNRL